MKTTNRIPLRLLQTLLLSACCWALPAAHAQSVDKQHIIDALKPDAAPVMRTRSLRNLNVEQTGETAASSAPKFVALTIGFQFDSAQITADSANTLNTLAKALKSDELRSLDFMIEGHTDGQGTADYNLKLSQQRAAAVKAYLVRLGVTPQRLQYQGKGDTELVNTQDRLAAENRRVKIITLAH